MFSGNMQFTDWAASLRAIYHFSFDYPVRKLHIVEHTCFICYIIPNLWIKKTVTVLLQQLIVKWYMARSEV